MYVVYRSIAYALCRNLSPCSSHKDSLSNNVVMTWRNKSAVLSKTKKRLKTSLSLAARGFSTLSECIHFDVFPYKNDKVVARLPQTRYNIVELVACL